MDLLGARAEQQRARLRDDLPARRLEHAVADDAVVVGLGPARRMPSNRAMPIASIFFSTLALTRGSAKVGRIGGGGVTCVIAAGRTPRLIAACIVAYASTDAPYTMSLPRCGSKADSSMASAAPVDSSSKSEKQPRGTAPRSASGASDWSPKSGAITR